MTTFYKLKTFLFSSVLALLVYGANAQTPVANLTCGYAYSNPSPTWTTVLNGTGTSVVASGTSIDDQNYLNNLFPDGFTFDFNGTIYTSFNVNANGFIFFGNTDPGTITNPISNATTAYTGAIAALGANIQAHNNASNTPQIIVNYNGTAPNRVATIEWVAFKPQNNSGGFCSAFGFQNGNRYDFQIKLYENGGAQSNVIEILHKNQSPVCIDSNGLSAQVGLRGATNTDYRNRSFSGGTTNNSNTSEGSSNTASINHGGSGYFNANTCMRYTPKIQPAVIVGENEICLGEGGTTLSQPTNTGLTGITYQWYASPANTPISGATSSTYAINPGLGSTSYYVVVSNTDGCVRVSEPFTVSVIDCGNPSITVTATAGTGGTISPSGTSTYNAGDTPTYTFTPNCGYEVASVTVNGSPVTVASSYTFAALAATSTINVTFSLKAEVCNGIDDDCDGIIDNVPNLGECQVCQGGSLQNLPVVTWYQDSDGDGFGNQNITINSCIQPAGYVNNGSDCDDTDNTILNTCMATITASANAGGTITPSGNTSVSVGANQTYTITANCGYNITDVLVNGSSVGAVTTYTFSNVQVDQTIQVVFTQKLEVCNGIDDDCDGVIDNVPNLAQCQVCQSGQLVTLPMTTYYADQDGDGHGDINNSITDCSQPTGYVTSNNDCDDSDFLVWLAKPTQISLTLNPNSVCSTDAPIQLGTAVPANGTWSGQGVSNGMFDPSVTGLGTFTVTYFVQGDGACNLPASSSATMSVIVCTNIDELSAAAIKVYPTQTTGIIKVEGPSLVSATMMDMNGKFIETVSLQRESTIDISSYPTGMYMIHVAGEKVSRVHKVIKMD
jgi:hypothetical protein